MAILHTMLLFLPGLICDARVYAPQLAAFDDSCAVDGYGMADTLQDMARVALSQVPGDARFDLFGHSMGGRVALEVYRLAPDRVRRLAISSTGTHPLGKNERANRAGTQAIGHDSGFEALVDAWLPPMIAEVNRVPDIYDPLKAMCMDQGQGKYDAQIKALLDRPEVEGLLPQISCPTMVMTGTLDAWSPPAQHEGIAKAIPNSELVIVEGAGHMIQYEAPDAVNTAIDNWRRAPMTD